MKGLLLYYILVLPCLEGFHVARFPFLLKDDTRSDATCIQLSRRVPYREERRPSYTVASDFVGWFPRINIDEDDIYNNDESLFEVEELSVQLAADLVRGRLERLRQSSEEETNSASLLGDLDSTCLRSLRQNRTIAGLIQGRFIDLTCTAEGEAILEDLFLDQPDVVNAVMAQDSIKDGSISGFDVIRGAVIIFQSLAAMGSQVGVTGTPEKIKRNLAHLDGRNNPSLIERDLLHKWDRHSVRRLKYRLDRTPALALLAKLLWKRTPQGAFDLLVALGAWQNHEDLALLRSGFALRFTEEEEEIARQAFNYTHDPDAILGLRKDLRHLKVYTIDGPLTSEIDDGLSVELVQRPDGTETHRIWVHIADADRWAPRNSSLFDMARQRVTSLYTPSRSISMFPLSVSTDLMSLKAKTDCCAMSVAVQLNKDGSIDPASIIVTPSTIRVTYRLTYDDVDEMLSEGIGYSEEWELGALLSAAQKRRTFRIANGSSEGLVPNPIPYASISTFPNSSEPDGVGISLSVQVSHNAGKNETSVAEDAEDETIETSVSSAYLLVTEAMILAGESLGHWQSVKTQDRTNGDDTMGNTFENILRLGFRTQPKPNFNSRSRERQVMLGLLEYNVGGGYCHAWYARRFLEPVKVTETKLPHSGLGLGSYVQWTSPIRRFGDLQVHACVKRFIRREKVFELIGAGEPLPSGLDALDLGFEPTIWKRDGELLVEKLNANMLDRDINYLEGLGLVGAARTLQRQSQQYWQFEYVRRLKVIDPDKTYEALVLGCIDPEKGQFSIYVYELGLEHRYTFPGCSLDPGTKLQLRVDNVVPRSGILYFVRAV